jgi:hypothetical protein
MTIGLRHRYGLGQKRRLGERATLALPAPAGVAPGGTAGRCDQPPNERGRKE